MHLPNIIHLTTVATRLLFLVSLFIVLVAPRVSYVNTNESHAAEDVHAQSAFLLPPSSSRTHYGTFSQQYSPSGTVTPTPSEQGPPQNGSRKVPIKPTPKKEVDPDPVSGFTKFCLFDAAKLTRPQYSRGQRCGVASGASFLTSGPGAVSSFSPSHSSA